MAPDLPLSGTHGPHRPEIDGLRALAIIGVLLFHFSLAGVNGGFAGVDVFFVISGCLMTETFVRRPSFSPASLTGFYRRRFWRIAPAYYCSLMATMIAGALLLLPEDAGALGLSAVWSAVFLANFHFSTGAGYFDTASVYKPLLHLWSLAVEMQFYLVWPLCVWGLMRLPPSWRMPALAGLLAVSFVLCQILAITDPKVAFFAMPARLWEFALGGMVALLPPQGEKSRRPLRWQPPVVNAALVLIVLSMVLAQEDDPWPAPFAVPVAAATAVLLRYGHVASMGRTLLVSLPMQFIGKISYSLYLVHWPVAVFAGYAWFPKMPAAVQMAALLSCLPLAWLLYHSIEVPMRALGRRPPVQWHRVLSLAGAGTLALAGFALQVTALRKASPSGELAASQPQTAPACRPWQGPAGTKALCLLGEADGPPRLMLWGDSHAAQFVPGFAELARRARQPVLVAVRDACPPLAGVDRVSNWLSRPGNCQAHNAAAFRFALENAGIRQVVIAARWAFYAETTRFGEERGGRSFLTGADDPALSVENSQLLLRTRLLGEIGQLAAAGKQVLLIAQVPEMGFDAARCVRMLQGQGLAGTICRVEAARVTSRQAFATQVLAQAARLENVRVLDPKTALCDEKFCTSLLDGQPAFRDNNHLSAYAARQIVERMPGGWMLGQEQGLMLRD